MATAENRSTVRTPARIRSEFVAVNAVYVLVSQIGRTAQPLKSGSQASVLISLARPNCTWRRPSPPAAAAAAVAPALANYGCPILITIESVSSLPALALVAAAAAAA